jgi:hypothetical protein
LLLLFGGSVGGFYLQGVLQERHKNRETLDAVRLIVSILVTFTALVLGLVTTSVKASHDLFDIRLRGFAGEIIELDQRMREYGDGAGAIRAELRKYVAAAIADTWRDEPQPSGDYPHFTPTPGYERAPLGDLLMQVDTSIRRLEPSDAYHAKLAEVLAARLTSTLADRWLLIVTAQDTVSLPLIALVVAWLTIIFGVFGLCSPRNRVVYVTIALCAVSISSSIYLIMDLDRPLEGLVKVSSAPMRDALRHVEAP